MHMDLKFATNLEPLDDVLSDDMEQMSVRSMSPALSDKLEIEIAEAKQVVKDPAKCLIKVHHETRDKMKEIVKDFPSMRSEVGGNNFDKTFGEQLLSSTKECLDSLDTDVQQTNNVKENSNAKTVLDDKDSKVVIEEKNLMDTSPEIKNRKLLQSSIERINESRPST